MKSVVLLAVAALVRIPYVWLTILVPGFGWRWGGEIFSIGNAIFSGEGFASPYFAPTGPTAQQAPIFPYFIAGLAWLGGMEFAIRAVLWLNIVWSSLTALVVGRIADHVRPGTGTYASWTWALAPLLGFSEVVYPWNTALYVLALMTVLWRLIVLIENTDRTLWDFVIWGSLCGLTILLDPAHTLVVVAGTLLLLVMRRISWRELVGAGAVAVLVISPWLARNLVVFGQPMLRSNFGYEIVRGLSPGDDGQITHLLNPGRNAQELERYSQLGEGPYMAQETKRAGAMMLADPARTAKRAARRFFVYWTGNYEVGRIPWPIGSLAKHLVFLLPAVAGFAALVVLLRRPNPALALLATAVVVFPLPYYLTLSSTRYRAPLEPIFIVLVVCALATLAASRHLAVDSPSADEAR